MALVISDEDIKKSGLSEQQFRVEIAVHLYALNVFTLGQAAAFSTMSQAEMMENIGTRKIPVHYTLEDLEYDYKNILKERDVDYK